MQAEGRKQGVPVAVGIALPGAVAGIAHAGLPVFCHGIVFGTLGIAQLASGNGQGIQPPVPGQGHIPKGLLPDFRRLHIRCRVCVTGQAVGMLLQGAGQFSLLIPAVFPVGMGLFPAEYRFLRLGGGASLAVGMLLHPAGQFSLFVPAAFPMGMGFFPAEYRLLRLGGGAGLAVGMLLQIAGQNLIPGITRVRVLMGRFFCLTADQLLGYSVARLPMDMPLRLLLTADQIALLVIAFCSVCMAGAFRHTAHQILGFLIAFFGMGMLRLCGLGADQVSLHRGIAGLCMCVLRNFALLFQRNGWQDQSIGRAEHNRCRQAGHNLIPTPLAPMGTGIWLSILQEQFIHPTTPSILFQFSEFAQGENPEYNFSDNLFLRHTADLRMPGIHRGGPMVSHTEVPIIRHLIGKLNIAAAKGFLRQIRLLQQFAVHIDVSAFIDIHPLTGTGNAALYQYFVSQIKGHQIPRFKIGAFHRNNNISFVQRRRHGPSVYLQNRHPDRSDKNGNRRHDNQHVKGAAQNSAVPRTVLYPLQLCCKLLHAGVIHRLFPNRFHFVLLLSSAMRRIFSRYSLAALSAASNTPFSCRAASAMEPARS